MPFVQGGPNPSTDKKEYQDELDRWAREHSKTMNDSKTAMADMAAAAPAPRSEVQEVAARRLMLQRDARKGSLRMPEERNKVARLGFDRDESVRLGHLIRTQHHGHLVLKRPEETAGTGMRLVEMGVLSKLISQQPCMECRHKGTLVPSAMLEEWHGLSSKVRCWCTRCRKVTDEFQTSRALPASGKGRALMEVNSRAYLGATNAGLGYAGATRMLGALDLHVPSKRCWYRMGTEVKAAMIAVGTASERKALLEERRLSFEASGGQLDDKGHVGLAISFDGAWQKPGQARNSQEGYSAAIGVRSGKVVASARRSKQCRHCKPGAPCERADCNANHVGASGAMEPAMGAELVDKLNADQAAVFVSDLVTDLDSKIHKAVEAACAASGEAVPQQRSDPNHAIKAAKKTMMPEAKKQAATRGALTQKAVDVLMKDLAAALNQHRGKGDPKKLTGALLNVIDHAYGRHGNCLNFFDCPCARGRRWGSAYDPSRRDGLAALPSAEKAEAALREEWRKRLTSDAKLTRLLHGWSTQRNEAFNSLKISLHPKRMHLAIGDAGLARLMLAVARFNGSSLGACEEVLEHLGAASIGVHAKRALGSLDQQRAYNAKHEREPENKGKRREARKRRKARDRMKPGQQGAYGAGVGLDADTDDNGMSDGGTVQSDDDEAEGL